MKDAARSAHKYFQTTNNGVGSIGNMADYSLDGISSKNEVDSSVYVAFSFKVVKYPNFGRWAAITDAGNPVLPTIQTASRRLIAQVGRPFRLPRSASSATDYKAAK